MPILAPTEYPTLFLAMIGGSGLLLLGRSFWAFWNGDGSLQWPTVEGVVQRSSVEHQTGSSFFVGPVTLSRKEEGYHVTIEYAYQVGDHTYVSDRWSFSGPLSLDEERSAVEKAQQYREGTPVRVYYDPKAPEVSTLKTGDPDNQFWGTFVGLGTFLFALYGYLAK